MKIQIVDVKINFGGISIVEPLTKFCRTRFWNQGKAQAIEYAQRGNNSQTN